MSDHFLMLWLQKDSLDTVGFRSYSGESRVLTQKVTFGLQSVPGGVTGIGLSPKIYHFWVASLVKLENIVFYILCLPMMLLSVKKNVRQCCMVYKRLVGQAPIEGSY